MSNVYAFCAKYMKYKTGTFMGTMTKFYQEDDKICFIMFCKRKMKERKFCFPKKYLGMTDEEWQKEENK